MKIEIPESLYEYLTGAIKHIGSYGKSADVREFVITFNGPYGQYEVKPIPDERYCEKVMVEVLKYKEKL